MTSVVAKIALLQVESTMTVKMKQELKPAMRRVMLPAWRFQNGSALVQMIFKQIASALAASV